MLKRLLFIFIFLAAAIFLFKDKNNQTPANQSVIKEYKATIKLGEKTFDIAQFIGKTALIATEAKVKVEKTGDGENTFFTAVEGRVADRKKREFWEFLINGKQAEVGAGSYIIQNGDQIEWKISNY